MKYLFTSILTMLGLFALAEGTKELAPNEMAVHSGRVMHDETGLYIGAFHFGYFADFKNTSISSRMNVRILDPANESILLGFGKSQDISGDRADYRYYVKDPNGNVIYRSRWISPNTPQIRNWREAVLGPDTLTNNLGYDQTILSSAQLTQHGWNGEGDYFIEFERREGHEGYIIRLWDVTVVDHSQGTLEPKMGRLWSKEWALFTLGLEPNGGNFQRSFNGSFYIVAPDPEDPGAGFITKMNFNGSTFRSAAFSVALNSVGVANTGNWLEDRKSITNSDDIIGQYPVYLNDPIELYRTAELGELQILSPSGCLPDNFCFRAITTEPGEIEVLLDFEGNNGVLDLGTADRIILLTIRGLDVNNEICIPWDGVDGLGNLRSDLDGDSVSVYTTFRQGIFNFPVYDVEINEHGYVLESVRPQGIAPVMYYDDSNIPYASGTGSPNMDLSGCVTPCHTWRGSISNGSYGNWNLINSWWFAQTLIDVDRIALGFNKYVDTVISICAGESVLFADSMISFSGEHIFYYSTQTGCDSTVRIHADVIDIAARIDFDSDTLNCFFSSIQLDGIWSTPLAQVDFFWQTPNGIIVVDQQAAQIEISAAGRYMLRVTDQLLGCADEATIDIAEDRVAPEITFDHQTILPCRNTARTISTQINNAENFRVLWTTNDGNIVAGDQSISPMVNRSGEYNIEVINLENGCISVLNTQVVRDTTTYIELTAPVEITTDFCELTTIPVSLNSSEIDSIIWSPNEFLSCGNCLNPSLLSNQPTTYLIQVVDTNGCVLKHTVKIKLNKEFELFFPTAFSPNNDGINESFGAFSSECSVDILEFHIYDRWGNRLHERTNYLSTDLDHHWNGTYQARQEEIGTYIYYAKIQTYSGETVIVRGDFQLIR